MVSIFKSALDNVELIDINEINENYIEESILLTQDIDIDDFSFIATSLQFNAPLWTGDKKLIEHLKSKNFELVIDTNSLIELTERLRK